MKKRRAVIIGGGIAGPATAMFLERIGFEAAIYEARPEPQDEAGAFLNLAPNGLRVLRELGLLEEVRAHGFDCSKMVFRNHTGKVIGTMRDSREAEREGLGSIIIKRGLLNRVLREAAIARGIDFCLGKRLVDVGEEGTRAIARFADGSEASGDVLFGCDGIHSRTRRAIFPNAPTPSYTGMIDCGGFAFSSEVGSSDGAMTFTFGRRAFFGWFGAPTREIYWFQNTPAPEEPSREARRNTPREQVRLELLELHRDDASPIPEILRATEGPIGRWPLYDMPPLFAWSRGPICLVGDAAHAVSPRR